MVQSCTAWFRCCTVLVQVWVGVGVQVCVVQCCGSVACGVVHMWFIRGSCVVHMCVCICVCSTDCGPVLCLDVCGMVTCDSVLVQWWFRCGWLIV